MVEATAVFPVPVAIVRRMRVTLENGLDSAVGCDLLVVAFALHDGVIEECEQALGLWLLQASRDLIPLPQFRRSG